MPGPSQAGKFKPRKPAKKIRAGAAAAAAVVPVPVPDAAPSTSAARGGRGAGRGGRSGGRGRGGGRRGPQPQGQAFFTPEISNNEKKPRAAKSKSKGTKINEKGLVAKRKDESTEEVVGQLDKAIGSSLGEDDGGKRSVLEDYNDNEDFQGQSKFNNADEGGHISGEGIFYDSDSSLEEAKPRPHSSSIPPSKLPYPMAPLPIGIGADKRPPMYEDNSSSKDNNKTMDIQTNTQTKPSPFVDITNKNALQQEMDSFFLFQFPTRLPSLVQTQQQQAATNKKKEPTDNNNHNMTEEMDEAEAETKVEEAPPTRTTAEVVTPPVKPGSFDNSMMGSVPGRLGKLVVYKSGKTVLIFQGPDGSSEIRMNVAEGLTCGFEQHAVLIDPDEGRFVKLGGIHKTAVVTPDLDNAFAE